MDQMHELFQRDHTQQPGERTIIHGRLLDENGRGIPGEQSGHGS